MHRVGRPPASFPSLVGGATFAAVHFQVMSQQGLWGMGQATAPGAQEAAGGEGDSGEGATQGQPRPLSGRLKLIALTQAPPCFRLHPSSLHSGSAGERGEHASAEQAGGQEGEEGDHQEHQGVASEGGRTCTEHHATTDRTLEGGVGGCGGRVGAALHSRSSQLLGLL